MAVDPEKFPMHMLKEFYRDEVLEGVPPGK
jgi:hypothetical protein